MCNDRRKGSKRGMLLTPSRRFREEDGGQGQHPTGNQLDGERNVPLLITVRDVQVDSVVDPEPDDGSDLPPGFVNTDQSTSNSRWRDLRDVDGLHNHRLVSLHAQGRGRRPRPLTVKLLATPTPHPTINRPAYMIPNPVLLLATI